LIQVGIIVIGMGVYELRHMFGITPATFFMPDNAVGAPVYKNPEFGIIEPGRHRDGL
jgi:hypothetical protein